MALTSPLFHVIILSRKHDPCRIHDYYLFNDLVIRWPMKQEQMSPILSLW